jgi:hypothetical protein
MGPAVGRGFCVFHPPPPCDTVIPSRRGPWGSVDNDIIWLLPKKWTCCRCRGCNAEAARSSPPSCVGFFFFLRGVATAMTAGIGTMFTIFSCHCARVCPHAESIILSAPPTKSMMLSVHTESIILSAPPAKRMILSAQPAESIILLSTCADTLGTHPLRSATMTSMPTVTTTMSPLMTTTKTSMLRAGCGQSPLMQKQHYGR